MESYFQKIDSIVNILASLDARVNDEDVIHYVLKGLSDTYNHVCGYMHWKDTFLYLKTVRSLLITEEMRLKSRTSTLVADSSSLMVLVAKSGNTRRSSSTPQVKSSKPCFNFAKGNCRYCATCRYSHDANARSVGDTVGVNKNHGNNDTNELLAKLLTQLGNLGFNTSVSPNANTTNPPVAFHDGPSSSLSPNDFMTRRVLLRCDSTGDLYPVTAPSPIPHAFLVSQHTWHQRLGHQGSDVLRRLVSNNVISCNKEKPPVLCHACQLGNLGFNTSVSPNANTTNPPVAFHDGPSSSLSPNVGLIHYTPSGFNIRPRPKLLWPNSPTIIIPLLD
nr:ribonuclease H-like domain-containing protein [Tanacetum cinerariifolium]